MTMVVTCPRCQAEYEATCDEIGAGTWRRHCPVCHLPPQSAATTCEGCGRPLRAGNRRICAACLGIAA